MFHFSVFNLQLQYAVAVRLITALSTANSIYSSINSLFLERCTHIIIPITIKAIGDKSINPLFS